MRIAVVGAGLYGCTTAIALRRAGHEVSLFERHASILRGATASSCNRVHLGYHYPRSDDTARAAIADTPLFVRWFASAIYSGAWQHYVIAGDGLVTREQFVDFMHRLNMPYGKCEANLVRGNTTDDVFIVPEMLVNVNRLRQQLDSQLIVHGVERRMRTIAHRDMPGYDATVMTTYGVGFPQPLQYEVTEVAVVRLDRAFNRKSFVILDGPFACVDPLPDSSFHLLYDVTHSVHHRSVGMFPEVPSHLVQLLDRGLVTTQHTHVKSMLDTLDTYLHGFSSVNYAGSMFTVRAVLPDVDSTDERPTLVTRSGDTVHVLSGKLSSAVAAADHVVGELT